MHWYQDRRVIEYFFCLISKDFKSGVGRGRLVKKSRTIKNKTVTWGGKFHKFPAVKPLANQICLVAAGPGRVVQHVALRWDEYEQEFMWVDSVEDSFDPFPTEEATHWMPFPDDPEA